jgi:nucleotide-binding universal stress UspA family protein
VTQQEQHAVPTGIVVGVDDSASARAAVAWGAVAAARRGVDLDLVEVLPFAPEQATATTGSAPGTPYGRARALLARAERIARSCASGLTVTMHTLHGRVGPALVDYACEATMLVLGSNGPGGPIPLSLGAVVGEVTRHCSCPVVLVPPAARDRKRSDDGPVLVALEDGPDGDRALSVAAEVASHRGVPLTALVSAPAAETSDDAGPLDRIREQHPDLRIDCRTITTSPSDELLAAGTQAGLIVVPSQGRRPSRARPTAGWTGHFLPVLSTCPVAVVSAHMRSPAVLA